MDPLHPAQSSVLERVIIYSKPTRDQAMSADPPIAEDECRILHDPHRSHFGDARASPVPRSRCRSRSQEQRIRMGMLSYPSTALDGVGSRGETSLRRAPGPETIAYDNTGARGIQSVQGHQHSNACGCPDRRVGLKHRRRAQGISIRLSGRCSRSLLASAALAPVSPCTRRISRGGVGIPHTKSIRSR